MTARALYTVIYRNCEYFEYIGTDRTKFVEMKWPDPSYPLEQTGRFIKNTEIVHRLPNSKDIKTNMDLAIPMATSCYLKNQAHWNRAKFSISGNLRKSVAELDFYLPSCSLPILRVKKGRYYYMCTRNNNFTNRSQKGCLVVR